MEKALGDPGQQKGAELISRQQRPFLLASHTPSYLWARTGPRAASFSTDLQLTSLSLPTWDLILVK